MNNEIETTGSLNSMEDRLHFYCSFFVDEETKVRYDKNVSGESKS